MSARLKEQHSEEDWKNKYYQILNEMDKKEHAWTHEENQLNKSILRLSFAFSGHSPQLDKELNKLREELRKKPDDALRKQLINNIIEKIVGASSNSSQSIESKDAFLEFLDRLSLPGEVGAEIVGLRKRAASLREESEKLVLLDELVAFLQDTYKDTLRNTEEANAIELSHLKEVLLQLLEWLPLPNLSGKRFENIKRQLTNLDNDDDLKKILRQIAALISDLQSNLQNELLEIENFLVRVTQRLEELESHIQDVVDAESKSQQGSETLNAAVHNNVSDIRNEIEQATNLDEIKQSITQRLITIEQNMDSFLTSEQQRRSASQTLINELNRRITDMQSESEQLQQRIKDEQERAKIDALTSIPNRQAYNEQIQQEFGRWQRYQQTLTLCVIDVDRFKAVNDNYGHKAGDKVLSTVAELCQSRVREMDFLARYGGEEFVLLLPGTPRAQALTVADNLRKEIEECNFHYAKQPVAITVSCGLAEIREGDTPDTLFSRADKALYAAKNGGRNCCKEETE